MDGSASLARVLQYVEPHREWLQTPGLAVGLTDRERFLGVVVDGLANVEAGEPVAAHHRFQIGSISKGFTAMAVLRQAEAGRVELDAPVSRYLPWFEVRSSFAPITVHHLLSHTSGLVTGTDFTGDATSEVWSLRDTETGFAPGERFLYSNLGYKALGLVLEAATGKPWWETVHREVMEPIGMGEADVVITDAVRARQAVGYESPLADRPWFPRHGWAPSPWFESRTADGTICATAEELTAYARLLLAGGSGVLSPASFAAMTTPYSTDPEDPDERFGYGLKWVESPGAPRLLGHTGGMIGFTALLLVDPESGFGAVALMNSVIGDRYDLVKFALACLAAEASGAALPSVPEPPDRYGVESAGDLRGRYADEAGEVVVEPEGTGAFLEVEGRRARLAPIGDDLFAVDHPELERHPIRFLRDTDAVVGAAWGPRLLRSPTAPPATVDVHPESWAAYPGRYASWNPWAPGFRVHLRGGELWLSHLGEASDVVGEHRLTELEAGRFRVGEAWSPDRVRFDTVIDGVAQRAVFDAAPYFRTLSP
jgi:CubicO group peptidase (beta-lactamase class C family)